MNRHDYQGRREADPQCEHDYTPEWSVRCDSCGEVSKWQGGRPDRCPECGEIELDALTIKEVPA